MGKKFYWLRLKDDFFTSKAMKKLRKIAGGDTYTIIYLKMQLLSLKDEGLLFFEGIENTFYEEIALTLDEDVENVQATIIFLENAGLLEKKSETEYLLTQVPYLIGSEGDSAERVRRHRERKALLCNGDVTESNALVTKCNTEIEKEIDIEKEIERKEEKRKRFTQPTLEEVTDYCNERGNSVDPQRFIDYYTANGWKVGKNPMKDWRAAVRTWERGDKKEKPAQELNDFYNMAKEWAET